MQSHTIPKQWYEEIKDLVDLVDPYEYEERGYTYVEVDVVDEEEFIRVSKELGWMV